MNIIQAIQNMSSTQFSYDHELCTVSLKSLGYCLLSKYPWKTNIK